MSRLGVREQPRPSTPTETGAVVEAIDLRKRFEGHEVLRGVSFNAQRGETLVIMGGSGSGKTVTLRLVAGLIRPSSGRVRVFDRWIEDLGEEALAYDPNPDDSQRQHVARAVASCPVQAIIAEMDPPADRTTK